MSVIAIKSEGFALQPQNLDQAMKLAEMLSSSSMVPKSYINKPQDTLVAMMMGAELGLNPIQALQNIAVINGKPSIYGDALIALVQAHKSFGGIEESFDDTTMTATCTVWRKGGSKYTQTFSKADAEKAGLWGKAGPWTQYPKRMIAWRAKGFALRNVFADALAGLITAEEAMDIPIDTPRDITPKTKNAEPKTLPHYPEESFSKNFPLWQSAIQAGKKTADQIIATVETKGVLTEGMRQAIRDCTNIDAETKGEDENADFFESYDKAGMAEG